MTSQSTASVLAILLASCGLALFLTLAAPAAAAPVVGFTEDWTGTSLHGWGGGTNLSNPGTGGVGGVGDGFLKVSLPLDGNFGTRSTGLEYAGDWLAAGIQHVIFSLNDVGAADPFEIHFCIGNTFNLWQSTAGFSPPQGDWQEYDVDLTLSGNFTQIIGTGTFSDALQQVTRILIRHDLAPYMQDPDMIHGDLGIDHLVLEGGVTRTDATTWGRIKRLYR